MIIFQTNKISILSQCQGGSSFGVKRLFSCCRSRTRNSITYFQGYYMRPSDTSVTVAEANHISHGHKPLVRSSPMKINGKAAENPVSY